MLIAAEGVLKAWRLQNKIMVWSKWRPDWTACGSTSRRHLHIQASAPDLRARATVFRSCLQQQSHQKTMKAMLDDQKAHRKLVPSRSQRLPLVGLSPLTNLQVQE